MESSQLLRLIRKRLRQEPDDVPDGWFTAAEWSRKWKVAPRTARDLLRDATGRGIMQSRQFYIESGEYSIRSVNHFKQA